MKLTKYFDLHKFDNYEKLALLLCLFFLVVLIVLSSFHEIAAWGVETDFYGAYSNYAKRWLPANLIEALIMVQDTFLSWLSFILSLEMCL